MSRREVCASGDHCDRPSGFGFTSAFCSFHADQLAPLISGFARQSYKRRKMEAPAPQTDEVPVVMPATDDVEAKLAVWDELPVCLVDGCHRKPKPSSKGNRPPTCRMHRLYDIQDQDALARWTADHPEQRGRKAAISA